MRVTYQRQQRYVWGYRTLEEAREACHSWRQLAPQPLKTAIAEGYLPVLVLSNQKTIEGVRVAIVCKPGAPMAKVMKLGTLSEHEARLLKEMPGDYQQDKQLWILDAVAI